MFGNVQEVFFTVWQDILKANILPFKLWYIQSQINELSTIVSYFNAIDHKMNVPQLRRTMYLRDKNKLWMTWPLIIFF